MSDHNPPLHFVKLEALSNDFVLIESPPQLTPQQLRLLADHRRGVGCDQVLLIETIEADGDAKNNEWALRIHNCDGSEAEQCGNGLRALACWLQHEHAAGRASAPPWTVVSRAGRSTLEPAGPDLWRTTLPGVRVVNSDLNGVVVDAGNPHWVVFADTPPNAERCTALAKQAQASGQFANGVNVGLAQCLEDSAVSLMVHERGAALTPACGSGAAAAALAAHHQHDLPPPIRVTQPGGELVIDWQPSADGVHTVSVTGSARLVFTGHFTWPNPQHP
jgi:diaminopimelate epimerase